MNWIKNMTVSAKMALSFGVMVLMLLGVSAMSFVAVRQLAQGFTEYRELARDNTLMGRVQANLLEMRLGIRGYLNGGGEQMLDHYRSRHEAMRGFLEQSQERIDHPQRAPLVDQINEEVKAYDASFSQIKDLTVQQAELQVQQLDPSGLAMRQQVTQIMTSANRDKDAAAAYHAGRLQESLLLARLYANKFILSGDSTDAKRAQEEFQQVSNQAAQLDRQLQNRNRRAALGRFQEAFGTYQKVFSSIEAMALEKKQLIAKQLDPAGEKVGGLAERVKLSVGADQDRLGPQVQQVAVDTQNNLIYLGLGALLMSGLLAFFLSRALKNLTGMMSQLVEDLMGASDQLASASAQISGSAQQLSSGASQQAASLQETSSSMEQVSAQAKDNAESSDHAAKSVEQVVDMVRQAAQSAQEAAGLALKARQSSQNGVSSVGNIFQSMQEIAAASAKVTEIIDVINDITHQTKMLATNAAIEAARAGDQGKGFAVVADEVSKLAENSKSAAKEIGALIRGAAEKAEAGHQLAADGEKVLEELDGLSEQVAGLIGQISEVSATQKDKMEEVSAMIQSIQQASKNQATGVSEVSNALFEMDKVTQSNAANAEESASSAEELNSQAESLKEMVTNVAQHFGTNQSKHNNRRKESQAVRKQTQHFESSRKKAETCEWHPGASPESSLPPEKIGQLVHAEQAIPLRDDFRHF